MGNKYGSNIRTLVAKNLVWNSAYTYDPAGQGGPAPQGLKVLDLPDDFSIRQADCVEQPFNGNWGNTSEEEELNPTGLLKTSRFSIKSVGIFCNLADGLVFSNIARRLHLSISAYTFDFTTQVSGTADFVLDSNLLVAANLDNLVPVVPTGISAPTFIFDNLVDPLIPTIPDYTNCYTLASVAVGNGSGRLSDYSYRTVDTVPALYQTNILSKSVLPPVIVPALNVLYSQELFFTNAIAAGVNSYVIMTAKIFILPNDGESSLDMDFYTPTINDTLDGKQVTFDAVMEVECTPTTLASA